jgi:predicted RNA binding protein YcfA (HicA-like mRNA interferase family)
MTSSKLLRKLRRVGAQVVSGRGKGGHVMVLLNGRRTFVPTGAGEIKRGTLRGILKALELRLDELK